MNLYLILFILIFIGMCIGIRQHMGIEDYLLAIFLSLALSFCVWAVILIVGLVTDTHKVEYTQKELYSLNTKLGVHGDFVLGTGIIQSEMYYFYIIKKDGGYLIEKVKASNAIVFETNSIPHVQLPTRVSQSPLIKMTVGELKNECGSNREKTLFYVPKGTVKLNMNVEI